MNAGEALPADIDALGGEMQLGAAPVDLEGLAHFAEAQRIDLTLVGPEAPLIAGIVDRFEARGLPIFGPSPDPARRSIRRGLSNEEVPSPMKPADYVPVPRLYREVSPGHVVQEFAA